MDLINVLSSGFWVCFVMAILFFIISIVLFFIFDIKSIFDIKTGRAKARTVKEMNEVNASTGRLKVAGKPKTQTTKLSESEKKKKRVPAVMTPAQQAQIHDQVQDQYYGEGGKVYSTEPLYADSTTQLNIGYEETTQLDQSLGETTQLDSNASNPIPGYAETSVLSPGMTGELDAQAIQAAKDAIHFTVIKKALYTHTNEMI